MYLSDKEAKQMIISIGKKMSEARFVTANDGNMTIRVEDDAVWATPTGVNKGDLTEDKLIKIRISDSKILEGTWKPTSEMQMHLNAYRTDDRLQSTAHAHPINLSTLACAGIELDLPTTPAACLISGRIPVVPFACAGTQELADSIIPYVKDYHVVNLANHGPLAWGKEPHEAWFRLEDAEASATLALQLVSLGRIRPLSEEQIRFMVQFHHIDMTEKGMVSKHASSTNQDKPISFSEYYQKLFQ